ncbi:MAG: hypothetical protein FWE22_08605 [Firmicutes bacterium]|nr:hypothetical protein [Bacillota bacterium]
MFSRLFFLNLLFLSNLEEVAKTYILIIFDFHQILLISAVTIGGVAVTILKIARKQLVEVIRKCSVEN